MQNMSRKIGLLLACKECEFIKIFFLLNTRFFISNTRIRNTRLKLAKNHAKAKQHPGAGFSLFENYLPSLIMLSSKTDMRYSNKCTKNCVCFQEIIWLIILKMRVKIKIILDRYDINRIRPRHGYEYTNYKISLSRMMVMCNKQHLCNIWSWIHEKVKQHPRLSWKKAHF